MNWYQENSKIFLTWFATYPNIVAISRLASNMETKKYPPLQSPLVVFSMHNEGLQPHAQSYEFMPQFTPQPHNH